MNHEFLEYRAKYRDAVTRRYRVTSEIYDEASRLMATIATPVSMRKGEYLQRAGVLAHGVYWLSSGVARAGFTTDSGSEVTLYFRADGETAISHDDLLRANQNELSHNFVIAETAILGFRIDWVELTKLLDLHGVLRDYYLKASEHAILDQGKRLYQSVCPAQGRLAAFRRDYPGLERRVSQKVVASFLGITPQYMSQLLRQGAAVDQREHAVK